MKSIKSLLIAASIFAMAGVAHAADNALKDGEKAYLLDCAQSGMTEVKLGNIAVKRAKNKDVKTFAEQMIQDHTKANNALKKVASKKGVNLPEDLKGDKAAVVAKFDSISSDMFDASYITQMVKDHKTVSEKLKNHLAIADTDLNAWTKNTLPTVNHHLEMAIDLDKKVK